MRGLVHSTSTPSEDDGDEDGDAREKQEQRDRHERLGHGLPLGAMYVKQPPLGRLPNIKGFFLAALSPPQAAASNPPACAIPSG